MDRRVWRTSSVAVLRGEGEVYRSGCQQPSFGGEFHEKPRLRNLADDTNLHFTLAPGDELTRTLNGAHLLQFDQRRDQESQHHE